MTNNGPNGSAVGPIDGPGPIDGEEDDQFATKWRQNRACARCRRLKMKCAFENPSYNACRRCYSVGVECSFDNDPTARFAKRKTRKTTGRFIDVVSPGISSESITGSRNGDQISQLQNLVKLVSTSLSSLEHDTSMNSTVEEHDTKRLNELTESLGVASRKLAKILSNTTDNNNLKQFQDFHKSPAMKHYPYIPFSSNIAREIIVKNGLISLQEFKIRHEFFLNEMLPYYPIISLSKNLQDFDYLYENDPLLLTGCVYVTTINDNGLFSKIKQNYYKMSNEELNQMLNYYLESFISYHVYIKSDGFTYQLVELCLILSLWCLPTTNSGHFKNQLNLLIGFNISMCIDLGDINKSLLGKMNTPVLPDDSEQRNHLRAFLSVYVSCGSLGLSLPRFKLVSWNKQHHSAILFLMKPGEVNGIQLPSRHDRFLCYFSKLIALGQEIFDYFSPNILLDPSTVKKKDPLFKNMLDLLTSSLPHIKFVLDNYEQKMYSILTESGFMLEETEGTEGTEQPELTAPVPGVQPKEKYLLSVIYYQLLMIIYDNIVTRYFLYESRLSSQNQAHIQETDSLTYIQYVVKLIQSCENLLKAFIKLGQDRTINLPTFFFYRPMHSLILLIKLRILINSLRLSKSTSFVSAKDLEINAEAYFDGVYALIHESQHKYSSIVCSRMAIILSRIEKWMQLSNGKKSTSEAATGAPASSKDVEVENESSNLVNLIDTSKEIENLRAPKEQALVSETIEAKASPAPKKSQASRQPSTFGFATTTPSSNLYSNSIQEIFEVIDSDLLNYLNPVESSIDFDSNFSNGLGNVNYPQPEPYPPQMGMELFPPINQDSINQDPTTGNGVNEPINSESNMGNGSWT